MTPYIGEIRLFAGSFAPAGWAFCDGRTLAIADNDTLFNLIGTTYGGDGQNTFNLPDLRGRVPLHQGTGSSGTTYTPGQADGVEQVTLTVSQIPNHSHSLFATGAVASGAAPQGMVLAAPPDANVQPYGTDFPVTTLNASSVNSAGGSQPHDNMQPYLCMNYIISLYGVYPTPT